MTEDADLSDLLALKLFDKLRREDRGRQVGNNLGKIYSRVMIEIYYIIGNRELSKT